MALNRLFQALQQQQNAQPEVGNLLKTTPTQPYQNTAPSPFQTSNTPWNEQIAGAIDYGSSSGDAWKTIGKEGVINYMGDSLRKKYGTDNLSNFRYVEDANTPGGYRLDWAGRQVPTGFKSALKNAARSTGLTMGGGAGDSGDGLGGGMEMQNAAEGLDFGATWEGEGGTTFAFYRKPDGSVGIKTASAKSNDTGDILTAAAILAGGYMAGTGALGGTAGGAAGGAAEGAVGSGAGFVGEGALSGVGTWDAALASSPSWSAGAAGAAGAAAGSGGGGAATTGGGFVGEGAASGIPSWDAAAAGGWTDLGGGLGLAGDGSITGATLAGSGGASASPSLLSQAGSFLKGIPGMGEFSWTSLIGPGLSLLGGAMNSKASGDAAEAQLQAAREAAARFEPWRKAGEWGVGRAATMLGKDGPEAAKAAFQVDPGYQWRVEKGENALTRAAAARGLLGSGKYLKDAMRFNQGEASQEFGNAYNRLTNLAGLGQTATQSSADYLTQGANAQAAGRVGQANAWNNAIGQGVSMYQNQQMMNRLFPSAPKYDYTQGY